MNTTSQNVLSGFPPEIASYIRRLRTDALGMAGVGLQLVLSILVLSRFDMLTSAFRRVFYLAAVCFFINHLLPSRFRLPFFALVGMTAVFLVMGGSPDQFWDPLLALTRSGALLAIGAVIITICLLPANFWVRAALLGAVGITAAIFRADLAGPDRLLIVWPVLASLFMFRVIVFLYDVATMKSRPRIAEAVSYFFLIPNICSSLFPLVDFKTFCRSHYDSPALDIYQRGTSWIVRGILQLLLYRMIQQLVAIDPQQVDSGAELIQYVFSTTFVYVQVSGLFHLSIGMVLLFGFNLPETNRRYFLAASFTDYWRRVNIYWKDFILKIFYYPAYFRLKSSGPTTALVLATLWSFFVTWALHLYQTWWIKGSVSLRWTDILFWSILAILVLVNSLWEMKRGRQRKLASSAYTTGDAFGLLGRTAGTFTCIAILWSLWSTPSLSVWVGMWKYFDGWTLLGWGAGLLGIVIAATYYELLPKKNTTAPRTAGTTIASPGLKPLISGTAALLALLVLINPGFQRQLDPARWQIWIDAVNTGDSMMDQEVSRNRGYYEQLQNVDGANSQLSETLTRQHRGYAYQGPLPVKTLDDFRFREALPNQDLQAYNTRYKTNSYGLRDDEYPIVKPPGTVRIAVLGSSHSMGWGVLHEETFESVLENRLNGVAQSDPDKPHFEVINFAMYGMSPLGEIDMLEKKVAAFHPDVVLLVSHPIEYEWVTRDLHLALVSGQVISDPYLQSVIQGAHLSARTHEVIAGERLIPYRGELLAWSYKKIAAEIRGIGALPLAAITLIPNDLGHPMPVVTEQVGFASRAGFEVFDYSRLFDGQTVASIGLPEGHHHMNPLAHTMVADALFTSLMNDRSFEAIVTRAAQEEAATSAIDRGKN